MLKTPPQLWKLSLVGLLVSASLQLKAEDKKDKDHEVIIVKGTKIEKSLAETIESVTVYSEQDFREQAVFEFQDLLDLAPNVYQTSAGEGFAIRGITQNSAATGAGDTPNAITYVDGVSLEFFGGRFINKSLWDVNQVAIFRGPQSSNLGRSALAGALIVTTNKPEPGLSDFAVRAGFGSYGTREYAAMANLSTGDNSAIRVTYQNDSNDGFIENITLNDDKYDARDNDKLHAKWFYQVSDNFDITANYMKVDTKRGQDFFLLSGSESLDARQSTANVSALEEYDGELLSLEANYAINSNWSLKSITATMDGQYDRFDDDDESPLGGNAFRGRDASEENFSQELRFNYSSENLNGVVGAYYFKSDNTNDTLGLVNVNTSAVGVPAQLLQFYPATFEVDLLAKYQGEIRNHAFFTEWVYDANDHWSWFAGFRYDQESRDIVTGLDNSLVDPNVIPNPTVVGQAIGGALGAQIEAALTQVNAALLSQLQPTEERPSTDYDAFLPQVGVTYNFDDSRNLSFFIKRGYRTGGAEVDITGNLNEYDPEYLTNYELSWRSTHLDNNLFFTANMFYSDWVDQQISFPIDGNLFNLRIENSGESELYGLELSTNYRPTDNFSTFFNVGYTRTKFTTFLTSDGEDLSGNRFALSPKLTASAGFHYFFDNNWFVGGNVSHHGESFGTVQNSPDNIIDARTLLNLKAGYEGENFDINVYGTNLTDELYVMNQGSTPNLNTGVREPLVRVGAPREFGIQFNYRFSD